MTVSADARPFARLFARETWFGPFDARPLALLRILLGLILLQDWADRAPDLFTFMGEDGVLPPTRWHHAWSMFDWVKSSSGVIFVDVLGLAAFAAFTVGYHTRLATFLAWTFELSVQHRNLLVCDSGDTVVRMLLFWGMFVDLGGRYSLDIAMGHRPPARSVPALGLRFMQMQIALIYVSSVAAKTGTSWADGTAVTRALSNTDFSRPLGAWLATTPLSGALTRVTLAIESGFPVLAFSPWCQPWARRLALVTGVGLHAAIFACMNIGIFSLAMAVSYLAFVDTDTVDWAADRFSFLRAKGEARASRHPELARYGLALLALQFVLIVHSQLRQVSPPEAAEMNVSATWQSWPMFAPNPADRTFRWVALGSDDRDHAIDLLPLVAPKLGTHERILYSRWNKLTSNLATQGRDVYPVLGRYLCDRYDRDAARPRLRSLVLYVDIEGVRVPNLAQDGPRRSQVEVLRQTCPP